MMRGIAAIVALAGVLACADLFGPKEHVITMDVAAQAVQCQGFVPQECLRVRVAPETTWTLFYCPIDGFEFQPGFEYTIRVGERRIENPPQDSCDRVYRLLAILRQVAV